MVGCMTDRETGWTDRQRQMKKADEQSLRTNTFNLQAT